MSYKADFAKTINEIGDIPLIMSACESYGMAWGCDEGCPVLDNGECGLYKDVDDFYEKTEED